MVGGVYQVTGKVDFLVQAKDSISAPGTDNVSVYGVNFTILGSGGAVVSTNTYFFNEWLSKENLAFVYKKALSSNTTYWYIPTNNLTSNGFWNSTLVADGTYTLQFTVYDTYFREATKEYVISVANYPTTPIINNLLWGDANVTLNFTGAGATSYRIYYDTDTGPPYQGTGADQGSSPIEITVDSTVTKTVVLTGLTNGQTYYFAIKGYNGNTDEESNYSVEVSATPNIFPPPMPENLSASLNNAGFVQLAWEENDSSTAEAAGFIIFRSQTSGSGFSVLPKSAQGYL